jgi:hypothetical protein
MKRSLRMAAAMLGLFALSAMAASQGSRSPLRFKLVLAPGLTAHDVDEAWGTGADVPHAAAQLQWQDAKGRLQATRALESPLARMQAAPVRGLACSARLVAVDMTAEAGSYSGPLTRAFQTCSPRPEALKCRDASGHLQEVRLVESGKSTWKRHRSASSEEWLQVSSAPQDGGFVTSYERYVIRAGQCLVKRKQVPGIWEADGPFPDRSAFP